MDLYEKVIKMLGGRQTIERQLAEMKEKGIVLSDHATQALIEELRRLDLFRLRSYANGRHRIFPY